MSEWQGWRKVNWFYVGGMAFILACIVTCSVKAATIDPIDLTFEPPTAYMNGSPLTTDEIMYYLFIPEQDGTQREDIVVDHNASGFQHQPDGPGEWCYTGYTIAIGGVSSDPSNTACKTVVPFNNPPLVTEITPKMFKVKWYQEIQVEAIDTDGDTLTYAATGLPDGMTISPDAGLIYGQPQDVGTGTATVTVSDGMDEVSISFDWETTYRKPKWPKDLKVVGEPGAP